MAAGLKYACVQAFCIPTEGDNDADATTHEVVGAPVMPAPPAAVVPPVGYQAWLDGFTKIAATGFPQLEAAYRAAPHDWREYLRTTNPSGLDRLKQVARDATTAAAAPVA